MKSKYGFSIGERGKFYNKDAVFNISIYLEPDVEKFLEKIVKKKNKIVQEMVNVVIKDNMKLSKTLSL